MDRLDFNPFTLCTFDADVYPNYMPECNYLIIKSIRNYTLQACSNSGTNFRQREFFPPQGPKVPGDQVAIDPNYGLHTLTWRSSDWHQLTGGSGAF